MRIEAEPSAVRRKTLALAGTVAVATAIAAVSVPATAQAARACWFTRVAGTVAIERGDALRAAYAGLVLDADDKVVAATDGRAVLTCSDGVEITVGGDTEIGFGDFPTGDVAGNVILDLIAGLARFVAPGEGSWSDFSVRTPQAIASVRSTEWITISAPERSSVFVTEGIVAVTDAGRSVETALSPGEGVDIADGRFVDGPKRWGEGRIAETMARLAFP